MDVIVALFNLGLKDAQMRSLAIDFPDFSHFNHRGVFTQESQIIRLEKLAESLITGLR